MKKLPLLLFFAISAFSSCKKSAPESTTLSGKWQTVASAISTGGGNTPWTEIPVKERTTLTLNENGSVSGGGIYASYTVKDNTTLVFKTADNKEYPNFYTLNTNELVLNSLACIEGCSIKYLRIK